LRACKEGGEKNMLVLRVAYVEQHIIDKETVQYSRIVERVVLSVPILA